MMSDISKRLRQRVRAIMPDLEIEHFEINQEGLINDIVVVNRDYVFRFTKKGEDAQILENEMKILDLIRPRIDVEVPTPIYRSHDSIVYAYLKGEPMLRETVISAEEYTQIDIAEQLGRFLYGLHTTNIADMDWSLPATRAPVTREKWLDIHQRAKDSIYPLLLKHQVQWAENLFDSVLSDDQSFVYNPVLIHGDLAPYHILFDKEKGKLSGVIDFGVAGLGDAALDIGNLISAYGESFVTKMQKIYPRLHEYLPRARFYAQSIELQWVLLGIETGETFWFTVHLGGARDIKI